MSTYAEVFAIAPAATPVRAPCCGRQQAADMLLALPAGLPTPARAALARRFRWRTLPAFTCDGCRATMHREGLVAGLGVRGSR